MMQIHALLARHAARALRLLVPASVLLFSSAWPAAAQEGGPLGEEDLAEIDLMRRRGELGEALAFLDEVLEEFPDDGGALALRARCRFERCDYAGALADARQADELLAGGDGAARAAAVRERAWILVELGRADEAVTLCAARADVLRPARDARDAWAWGSALLEAGRRADAHGLLRQGAEASGVRTWRTLLDQARCQHALGFIEQAATSLVAADKLATAADGSEPDVLAALGALYFEAYGEVDDSVSRAHSPAELYREALTLHPAHEGARLGMFELYRFNWRRSRVTPEEILGEILTSRPRSVRGFLAQASSALDDGALPIVRTALAALGEIAPGRRDVRTENAALAWVEHRRDEANAILAELTALDPEDPVPEREVGRHLLELYRFAEAKPFLERAVERDGGDWRAWRDLGRAQANTADEEAARASLAKAKEVAEGRRDAWRDNTALVLERMADRTVTRDAEELSFAWQPDAARVLDTYLVPFYTQAREELSARYGFTPEPVRIEVFRRWADFSVRSTGFEGFPALGVCFGPVVTAVSPLSEMRGKFSWARTSYHEFTHVIHLGLSHNRCPRWITEGLATWEEGERNPSWKRNLRRELVDARANGTIIPLRRLNNAFRGPRVIFAYFQSGLVCQMLIEEHGFPPIVRLLEAFDRGADLDQAFRELFHATPEEMDTRLLAFIDREIADLHIEPRWTPEHTFRLRFRLARKPPESPAARAAWIDDWCTVGWGYYVGGKTVDAEEALRTASTGGELSPRGLFLRAELLLARDDENGAKAMYERAFAAGGEDFRARIAYAALLRKTGDLEDVERELLRAQTDFPGFDDLSLSAEIRLAQLYEEQDRAEDAMEARMRWLSFNAGEYTQRVLVAAWLAGEGRLEESVRYWREANEVDPFRRTMHRGWGNALRALGRYEEAEREFRVALDVPAELDGDLAAVHGGPGGGQGDGPRSADLPDGYVPGLGEWKALEPELRGLRALTLIELGRRDEARAEVEQALELDADCAEAKEALALLGDDGKR